MTFVKIEPQSNLSFVSPQRTLSHFSPNLLKCRKPFEILTFIALDKVIPLALWVHFCKPMIIKEESKKI